MPGTSAGHLSVRVEGLHADDVPFLFERQPRRMGLSFVASAAFDLLIAILLTVASRYTPAPTAAYVPTRPESRIVWLASKARAGVAGAVEIRCRSRHARRNYPVKTGSPSL
jgi:hypothetical protein